MNPTNYRAQSGPSGDAGGCGTLILIVVVVVLLGVCARVAGMVP